MHATVVVTLSVAVTVWYSVARGQDFNWDQQNYHIGIPFLLLHGTFWTSVAPAAIQSYFNPCVLELQFLALRNLSPIGFAVSVAVVQSFAFMLAGLICASIARPAGGWTATMLGLLGFALCLTAPMPLSEAGTTFIDFVTAVPVVGAYALLLTRGRWSHPFVPATLAGALLGAATALKLTNGVFALGVVGFALAGPASLRRRAGWLLTAGGAAILAFAVVGGSWQIALWERFGNPFFPYYNNIFRSPDFPPVALRDARFLPHSVLDIWRYPYYWLRGGNFTRATAAPGSELAFIDARWIVAVGGITVFLAALPIFHRWARQRLADPAVGLLLAFTIDYLVWLVVFGIQRYAVAPDILCGAALLILAMAVQPVALRIVLLGAVGLFSWRTMVVPDWGHLPWRSHWQAFSMAPLHFDGPAIIFLTVKPSLFVAASLPANSRYVSIDGELDLRAGNHTNLTRQIGRELASAARLRLEEISPTTVPGVSTKILASYGLVVTNCCQTLHVADESFRVCRVDRRSASTRPAVTQ